MRVEEEWQLEDEAGWQSVETVAPKPPTRRRIVAAALLIAVGLGLSLLNRMAAPDALSAVTPAATLSVEPLKETIDREALALARGDREAFLALQDADDVRWYQSQQEFFQRWETPSLDSVPYQLMDIGMLAGGRAWADVRQLTQNGYSRETRFYREQGGAWVRTRPVLTFWGRERTLDTVHFHAVFADRDAELVQYTLARFEAAYARMCTDLGCEIRPEFSEQYGADPNWYSPYPIAYSPYPRVLTITLIMRPEMDRFGWDVIDRGQAVTITLPSPRVTGVVDGWLGQSDPIDFLIFDSLAAPVARIASGGPQRWSNRQDGQLFFDAIVEWERDWLRPLTESSLRFARPAGIPAGDDLLPLGSLWDGPHEFATDSARLDRMRHEAVAVVVYIGQQFGPLRVAGLLNALSSARSLPEAIENGLGLSYAEFESQWRAWLDR